MKPTAPSRSNVSVLFMANPGNRIWWRMVGESLVEDQLARVINEKLASIEGTNRATTEAWAFFDPKNWCYQMKPEKPL